MFGKLKGKCFIRIRGYILSQIQKTIWVRKIQEDTKIYGLKSQTEEMNLSLVGIVSY